MQELLIEKEPQHSLKDEIGTFILNGVEIKYTFKAMYIGYMPHIDFDSNKKPNLITETGYRSWFIMNDLKEVKSVREIIEGYCKDNLKNYDLRWGKLTELDKDLEEI